MLSITFIFSMRVKGTSLPLTLQLIHFIVLRYAEASTSENETLSTTIPEQLMLIKFFFPSSLLFNLPDKTKVSSRFSFREFVSKPFVDDEQVNPPEPCDEPFLLLWRLQTFKILNKIRHSVEKRLLSMSAGYVS